MYKGGDKLRKRHVRDIFISFLSSFLLENFSAVWGGVGCGPDLEIGIVVSILMLSEMYCI